MLWAGRLARWGNRLITLAAGLLLGVLALYPLAFTITPCLRAAGDVRFCLIGAMTGMWLGRILCSHLFVSLGWGIMGIWAAIVADWLIRIGFYLPRYFSGKWLKQKVI